MNGKKIIQIAGRYVGEDYILGTLVPKDNAKWKGPWDCAEFVSWCVFQASGILYGCENDQDKPSTANAYTGYWQRDAEKQGIKISIESAARTPGAAILRFPQPNAYGHIVLSDGKGGTIEAHSSKKGVIKSTVDGRRWDAGILVPGIEYEEQQGDGNVEEPSIIFRVVSPSISDKKVRLIQKELRTRGFDPGKLDGVYGPQTAAAVTAFQLSKKLLPDGEVGPVTAAALGLTLG